MLNAKDYSFQSSCSCGLSVLSMPSFRDRIHFLFPPKSLVVFRKVRGWPGEGVDDESKLLSQFQPRAASRWLDFMLPVDAVKTRPDKTRPSRRNRQHTF